MAGWKQWISVSCVVGAIGCHSTKNETLPNPTLPTSQGRQSLISRTFGIENRFVPQAPKSEPVAVRTSKKAGEGLKAETEVEIANAELEGAFMEGRSAVERDQLTDSARQRYQRALQKDSKNKPALVGLARLYTLSGDQSRAVATYQSALKHYPKDHDLAYRLATVQVRFEDWNGAAESCQFALSMDPENRTYSKTLGYCQAQLGQFQQAGETLSRIMPEPQALYFLGRVLIDQNRVEEGKQWIQAAAKKDPQFQVAKQFLDEMETGVTTKQDPVVQTTHTEPVSENNTNK